MTEPETSPGRYRWGISSPGHIAESFAQALDRVTDAELVAVGSRSRLRAERFGALHGATRCYGSAEELAADPSVDLVYVASPPNAHAADAITFITNGKHVLIEKPMAMNQAQGHEIANAASRNGVFAMEGIWSRFLPAYCELRELIRAGVVGTVHNVDASLGDVFSLEPGHRLLDPERGGGALLDLGLYPIQLAVGLLGAPVEISAAARLGPTQVDLSTTVTMRFATGALGTATCAIDSMLAGSARISGSAGAIAVPRLHHSPDHLIVEVHPSRNDFSIKRRQVSAPIAEPGLSYEISHVHQCLEQGLLESPLMPLSESATIATVLDLTRDQIGLRFSSDSGAA